MKEIIGNLWDYRFHRNVVLCITTNGYVKKKSHEAVMGAGCALEATKLYPGINKILGELILKNGNIVQFIFDNILAFPVKHNWWESANIELIVKSANELKEIADNNKETIYLLPRPGCGNGYLKWEDVKKNIVNILPNNVAVITH